MTVLDQFHPAVATWFRQSFAAPTAAQQAAWPAIAAGRHTLVAAPTGSGKTLTAFLAAIDELVRAGLDNRLDDEIRVVYVSPLKALSNDIQRNLQEPLAGILAVLEQMGLPPVAIRTAVRTGDTAQSDRLRMQRRPPHVLVTTPESLYVLLASVSGRRLLASTRTVIVDEIHAVAAGKRGSHLALSLQRLDALCQRPVTRIGLSATQKPIDQVAAFLTGVAPRASFTDSFAALADGAPSGSPPAALPDCAIVDIGYARTRDLAIEVPVTPLSAVMSNDMWDQLYTRLTELTAGHRTTLVFVNTRRMAERAARFLGEALGKQTVAAHHGSLSREARLDAEQRLKAGQLKVLVATASLELGIDIGDVDLVCQIGSPRSIAAFLQRVGRSGHSIGGTPKGRLFALSRDDLVECAALLDSVRRGELDSLVVPPAPLDVLAQHIVAEVACRDCSEDELFECLRGAWPYARLARSDYDAVVHMLADGYTTRRGPRAAYLHRDAVHRMLRARRGARMTATTSGGTIPDTGDYAVLLEPQAMPIGSVHEDFAVESLAGDIFQLGNTSYRILRIEPGRIRVEDARGAPPSIPFWLGEAPGRSDELSSAVSRLREEVAGRLDTPGAARTWLISDLGLNVSAAEQIVDYLARTRDALGSVPTQHNLMIERFFDESGGMQLVIHSPFGSRLNRAWGLALRKRFCRTFNFELQAAAIEDAIVLSLSTSHSFALAEVAGYLRAASALGVLIQALLDAPLFAVRWRWNATTALALPRFTGGKKVAAQLQRMRSEDLLASVFPDQVACAENLVGEREIPDHPLVTQTLYDCLHEAMDAEGWLALLRRIESGEVRVSTCESTAPSPLAAEILTAKPYAFLDDAPLEERRTQAVLNRRYREPDNQDDMGRLDRAAIADVRAQAWPQVRSVEEMHAALLDLGWIRTDEVDPDWAGLLEPLVAQARVTRLTSGDTTLWVCAERLPAWQAVFPHARLQPLIEAPADFAARAWTREAALVDLIRARLTGTGPITSNALAGSAGVATGDVAVALVQLEVEGYVMRGRFTSTGTDEEWCERSQLARIHRYTVGRLRREIEPVEPRDLMRFLFDWQRVSVATRGAGPDAVAAVLQQMEGFEAAAAAWENDLLPARVGDYSITWLDELCTAGRITWTRLRPPGTDAGEPGRASNTVRTTPIVLLPRKQLAVWSSLGASNDASHERDHAAARASVTDAAAAAATVAAAAVDVVSDAASEVPTPADPILRSRSQRVEDYLTHHGASFFDELQGGAHLLRTELEDALADCVARGRVHCDSFAGLRALLNRSTKRSSSAMRGSRHGRRGGLFGIEDAGRWALIRRPAQQPEEIVEHIARTLLRRYGVICWRLLEREAGWLPPWRELLRVYHRLEARGEIRGGRFVAGLSGEQFALPEAVGLLRKVRQQPLNGTLVCVSAMDPLNLTGTVLAGERVPRQPGARVVYRDGVPLAWLVAGRIIMATEVDITTLPAEQRRSVEQLLTGMPVVTTEAASWQPTD